MQISGHVLRSRYVYARRQGDEAFHRILDELGPVARQVMETGPLETNWYDFDILVEVSLTMDRVLGRGDMHLIHELGAFSCENNLTGIYRVFFRFGNLDFLLDRAAKAWNSQYDFGKLEVIRDPENTRRVTLELTGVPRPHRALYLAVQGWAVKAAELTQSEITKIEEEYSDEPGAPMRWIFEYL